MLQLSFEMQISLYMPSIYRASITIGYKHMVKIIKVPYKFLGVTRVTRK